MQHTLKLPLLVPVVSVHPTTPSLSLLSRSVSPCVLNAAAREEREGETSGVV